MLFDQFAAFVEQYRELEQLKPLMDDARHFEITYDEAKAAAPVLIEQLKLPFETVAIQFPASCIILNEKVFVAAETMPQRQGQLVVGGPWTVIEHGPTAGIKIGAAFTFVRRGRNGAYQFTIANEIKDESFASILNRTLECVGRAIGVGLATINQVDRFIVEVEPRKRIEATADRIARSHNRPKYILLRPAEIRQRFGLPTVPLKPGKSKRPHERRGHFRTFRSERWGERRGQRRWIRSMWIGPREAVVEKQRYRVVLD